MSTAAELPWLPGSEQELRELIRYAQIGWLEALHRSERATSAYQRGRELGASPEALLTLRIDRAMAAQALHLWAVERDGLLDYAEALGIAS